MTLYVGFKNFNEVDMDKVQAWKVIEKVLKNRDEIARQLKERTKIIKEHSLVTIRPAADILS